MTSEVKGWEQLFYVLIFIPVPVIHRKRRSQEKTTVDHADIRGLATTFLVSVGCLPHSRSERALQPHNANESYTTPGLRLFRGTVKIFRSCSAETRRPLLGSHRYVLGNRPHKDNQFTGYGDDLMSMF